MSAITLSAIFRHVSGVGLDDLWRPLPALITVQFYDCSEFYFVLVCDWMATTAMYQLKTCLFFSRSSCVCFSCTSSIKQTVHYHLEVEDVSSDIKNQLSVMVECSTMSQTSLLSYLPLIVRVFFFYNRSFPSPVMFPSAQIHLKNCYWLLRKQTPLSQKPGPARGQTS